MSGEMITILVTRYEELTERSAKLGALEAAGVDNWEGYGDAVRTLHEEDPDDE